LDNENPENEFRNSEQSQIGFIEQTTRSSFVEGNVFDYSLLVACVLYTFAAGSEYWLMSWLNYIYNIKLPIFFALLQNASWPIQGMTYWLERKEYEKKKGKRIVTNKMIKSYCILGTLNAVITLTRTVGITTLPPTIYAIVANTEIVFECLMTKLYLKREITVYQVVSMCLVIAGVIVSLWDPVAGTYGEEGDDQGSTETLMYGLSLSFLSRFASSWNTILADRFLGRDRKTQLGVLECSFFNALLPCLILPWVLLVAPEYQRWGDQLSHRSPLNNACVAGLLASVCVAKYGDRVSKFTVVSKASTMFFAVVDSNMKLFAGIGTIVFFSEAFTWGQGMGFFLIFVSLLISLYDKKLKVDKERAGEFPAQQAKIER